jgi:hypothetical protein
LGLKWQTDKATYHLFTVLYESFFQDLRDSDINLLEVGILYGSSTKMWEEYFTKAKIHAVDINDHKGMANDRIQISVINQENENDLRSLPKDYDIIIEDGGHTMLQQQTSLKVLFVENLKPGGTYVLEDLHTSEHYYWNGYAGSDNKNNTIRLLFDLKNGYISEGSNYFINQDEFNKLLEHIESIDIIKIKGDSVTSRIVKKK